MASVAPAFGPGSKDKIVAFDPRAHDPNGSWYHAFFLRRVQARGAQTDLIKSSAIKLAESQKLLAEVDALLRR